MPGVSPGVSGEASGEGCSWDSRIDCRPSSGFPQELSATREPHEPINVLCLSHSKTQHLFLRVPLARRPASVRCCFSGATGGGPGWSPSWPHPGTWPKPSADPARDTIPVPFRLTLQTMLTIKHRIAPAPRRGDFVWVFEPG